ncbi:MAG: acetylglutamate kinase [Robiginitomaculum sp.]|nr:acetylglutamate kinase [Robiginitomaculum sp.]
MTKQQNNSHETRQVVRELLGAMTEGREVRAWLKQFGKLERSRFAVIKIGGGTLHYELPTICSALAFLQKLGLCPVIVHGGGQQIDDALRLADIETPRLDGLRVTSDQAMPVIASALRETSLRFISALNANGAKACFYPATNVVAKLLDEEKFGRVGSPTSIDFAAIDAITKRGELPILTSVAIGNDGREVNVNADALVRELAIGLRPQKIIFLTPTGAILDENNQRISVVHLKSEYETMMRQDWLVGGMKLKLQQINDMLTELPLTTSAAITRPDMLIKELFTHSGSGTLIRKGENIEICREISKLDLSLTEKLIERAFERDLGASYWDNIDFEFAITSDSNRALALVVKQNGQLYLDKFAVLDDARGEGLGAAVWRDLRTFAPNLFWRSRVGNPVNQFYFSEADGNVKIGDWQVFWIGDVKWPDLQQHLQHIADLPDSFVSDQS